MNPSFRIFILPKLIPFIIKTISIPSSYLLSTVLFLLMDTQAILTQQPSETKQSPDYRGQLNKVLRQVSIDEVEQLSKQYSGNTRELSIALQKRLNEIYKNYPPPKKQLNDRLNSNLLQRNRPSVDKLNNNQRRVLSKVSNLQQLTGFFLVSSYPMYQLHRALASNLMQLPLPEVKKAVFHFYQSLRYRKLYLTKDSFFDENRLAMLADNSSQIPLARQYRTALEQIQKVRQALKDNKEELIILSDQINKVEQVQEKMVPLQQKQRELKTRLETLEEQIQLYDEQYNTEKINWEKESAGLSWEIAQAIAVLENSVSTQEKNKVQNNLYGVSKYNFKIQYNFLSSLDWLRIAHLLDPQNTKLLYQLAHKYYKHSYNKSALESFVTLSQMYDRQKTAITQEQKEEVYHKIAQLYTRNGEILQAVNYYEKLIADSQKTKPSYLFALGELHQVYTGKIDKAIYFLTTYIE